MQLHGLRPYTLDQYEQNTVGNTTVPLQPAPEPGSWYVATCLLPRPQPAETLTNNGLRTEMQERAHDMLLIFIYLWERAEL